MLPSERCRSSIACFATSMYEVPYQLPVALLHLPHNVKRPAPIRLMRPSDFTPGTLPVSLLRVNVLSR
jgi:hypothetical protein